jgi:hypothetical protein
MQTHELERKLRKLNPKLHIHYGVLDNRPASLWYDAPGWQGSEVEELCGIPKDNVPEWSVMSPSGKMLKGGWNRVLKLLVSKGLINRYESYKYFEHWDTHRYPGHFVEATTLDAAIKDIEENRTIMKRIENPLCKGEMIDVKTYRKDDIVDIGRLVKEKNQC